MEKNIIRDISAGMYILTTNNSGCFVDAVMQIGSGDEPLIAVSVMNSNFTNKKIKENTKFAISLFGIENNPELIKIFGMQSSKNIDKFKDIETIKIDDINIIKDSIGYMLLEKVDSIQNDTHTLFIGKVIKNERFNNIKPMTYQYYQEHKEDLLKIKTEKGSSAWICNICGYIYYGEELPDEFTCPKCKMPKSVFKKVEN